MINRTMNIVVEMRINTVTRDQRIGTIHLAMGPVNLEGPLPHMEDHPLHGIRATEIVDLVVQDSMNIEVEVHMVLRGCTRDMDKDTAKEAVGVHQDMALKGMVHKDIVPKDMVASVENMALVIPADMALRNSMEVALAILVHGEDHQVH